MLLKTLLQELYRDGVFAEVATVPLILGGAFLCIVTLSHFLSRGGIFILLELGLHLRLALTDRKLEVWGIFWASSCETWQLLFSLVLPLPSMCRSHASLKDGEPCGERDPLKASPTTRYVSQATSDCLIPGELPDSCCCMRDLHQPLTHKGPQMRPVGGVPSWAQPRWSTTQHFEQINVYYLGPLHLRMIWQAVLQLTPPDCKMCPWSPKLRIHAGNRCHLASLLTLCFL